MWIASVTGEREQAFTTGEVPLEAPNWTHDGAALMLNGAGKLWRFDVGNRTIRPVPLTGIPNLSNDHVLAPGGTGIYLSANDGHIYRGALGGGAATRITEDDGDYHYGRDLAYAGIEAGDFTRRGRLMIIPAGGGATATLTVDGHCDGPEYSPDGEWLFFNTEAFSLTPGHAQLARLHTSKAGTLEQVLKSDTVDWFPHLSPDGSSDGRMASYIRFPSGTVGHPADCRSTSCLSQPATGPSRSTRGVFSAAREPSR